MDEKTDKRGVRKVEGEGDDRVATRARGSHALTSLQRCLHREAVDVVWMGAMGRRRQVWMGWKRTHVGVEGDDWYEKVEVEREER
jgi:hypothetical protein